MKKLSIVIPCHNEAESLPALVQEVRAAVSRDDIEVVLVNDGSTDDSARVLQELVQGDPIIKVVTNEVNKGYGGAILAGLAASEGTYIGWMHGDLQTPFKDALQALTVIESMGEPKDLYVKGLRKGRSLFDSFFTFGMSIFESLLLGAKLYDINAQPNIFHRDFFASWRNPPRDFSLDLYAFYLARSQGLRVMRIPVLFPPRRYGSSHWNLGIVSRFKFIKRTVSFSLKLKQEVSPRMATFAKYLVAGAFAGAVHLLLLYAFTDLLAIHYLISTTLALFIVFWISFGLQKYWTFKEHSRERIGRQALQYFMMHSVNFAANAGLLYVFVEFVGLWYLFAQVVVSLSLALVTFLINRAYIFKAA